MSEVLDELYYDPYDQAIDRDPWQVFRRLREEQPLYRNEKHDFFAVSRFDDVRRAELDWQTYSSAKGAALELIKSGIKMPPGNIVFEDPPDHTAHRKMLSRMFSPRRIRELEPKIREFCVGALDPLVGDDTFDFVTQIGAEMPTRVIGMLMGIPEAEGRGLHERVNAAFDGTGADGAKNFRSFADLGLQDYIAWRREHPSDDIITELINATFVDGQGVERRLTDQELLNYTTIVAIAGNETTTKVIGWAGELLGRHPRQRALLVENPGLVSNAIEEVLRYESPSPVQARFVTRDVELYGETVPEGAAMLVLTGAANRDDRAFPDPDRFDVTRHIERHLAFAHGIHFCIGNALARLEVRIALEEVLKRWPTWEVDYDSAQWSHTSTVRGWKSLPVFVR
jgi:cytochrome P450